MERREMGEGGEERDRRRGTGEMGKGERIEMGGERPEIKLNG